LVNVAPSSTEQRPDHEKIGRSVPQARRPTFLVGIKQRLAYAYWGAYHRRLLFFFAERLLAFFFGERFDFRALDFFLAAISIGS